MSSTVFEWTIDDVSSLKPVHLEPHETQFQDSPDPELEAKAQSAISSYFKDQVIVPSPIDCPLRKHRIILSELNGVTPIAKNKSYYSEARHSYSKRNAQTQTKLSLPPILPPELEKMLSDFMQPSFVQSGSSTPATSFSSDADLQNSFKRNTLQIATDAAAKDVSLRRKLFDKHNIILLDNSASVCSWQISSSPTQNICKQRTAIAGVLSDSLDKSSNFSLSPISATGGFSSPDDASSSAKKQLEHREHGVKRKAPDFLQKLQDIEDLSPIAGPTPKSRRTSVDIKRQKHSFLAKYRGSPDLSDISAISHYECNENAEISIVQTREQQENMSLNNHVIALQMTDVQNITPELENTEEQQCSSNSSSLSCESEFSNTPRTAKRGKTKSKNLSQSFSAFIEDEHDLDLAEEHNGNLKRLDTSAENFNEIHDFALNNDLKTETAMVTKCQNITGCDSGFNDCSRVKDT